MTNNKKNVNIITDCIINEAKNKKKAEISSDNINNEANKNAEIRTECVNKEVKSKKNVISDINVDILQSQAVEQSHNISSTGIQQLPVYVSLRVMYDTHDVLKRCDKKYPWLTMSGDDDRMIKKGFNVETRNIDIVRGHNALNLDETKKIAIHGVGYYKRVLRCPVIKEEKLYMCTFFLKSSQKPPPYNMNRIDTEKEIVPQIVSRCTIFSDKHSCPKTISSKTNDRQNFKHPIPDTSCKLILDTGTEFLVNRMARDIDKISFMHIPVKNTSI